MTELESRVVDLELRFMKLERSLPAAPDDHTCVRGARQGLVLP
jgi:hypothetical protein